MRLKSHTPVLHASLTAASVVTLGLAGTFLYLMWRDGRATIWFSLFITPFLLMGVLLGYYGVRGLSRLAWHGSWQLEWPDRGADLGTPIRATLFPQRDVTVAGDLQCRLRCIYTVATRERSHRNTGPTTSDTTTLWEHEWTVQAGRLHPSLGVAMAMPLPDEGKGTNVDPGTGSGIRWQLNVVVPTKDFSHEAMFDVPVRANPNTAAGATARFGP